MEVADMLAGGGGTTEGAKRAGARVRYALNHWPIAIDVHGWNHPEVEHFCEDACLFDYGRWRGLDGILASIACQGVSTAATNCGNGRRNSLPKHDADRATAHAITHALDLTRVPLAIVECTVGLRSWELYPEWCAMLKKLGYALHEHVLDAADFGAPATRQRLYLTAVRASAPLVLELKHRQRVGVGTCFDESIAKGWKPVARMPAGARRRIARARQRHAGVMAVRYTTTDIGRAFDQVAPTMTTKHQCAWVRESARGDERRMWRSHEYAAALGFRRGYRLTGNVTTDCKLMGNAVSPLVMEAIVAEVMQRG